MKNKICIFIFNIFILLIKVNSQDDITLSMNCETGCIDLSISGGYANYDVEWQRKTKFNYETILKWPKYGIPGDDGQEDLCLSNFQEGQKFRVIVKDALCGEVILEFTIPKCGPPCSELLINVVSYNNVSECGGFDDSNPPPPPYDLCDGSISVSVEGTGASYKWSNGATGQSVSGLCTGSYTVTVTQGSCTKTETFNICCCSFSTPGAGSYPECETTSSTSLDADITSPTGPNTNNGSIELLLTANNFEFSWTGPNGFKSTSQNISGLVVGTYCVKVLSGCGPPIEKCFTLIDCSSTTISLTGAVVNTCSGISFGSIVATAMGGAAPYKYKWNNRIRAASITNLAVGTYCVTATDKNGCTNSACFTVGLNAYTAQDFTYPCEREISCNNILVNTVSYPSTTWWDCNIFNYKCSLTGEVISVELPYLDIKVENCIAYGLCREGYWTTLEVGNTIPGPFGVNEKSCNGGVGCAEEACIFPSMPGQLILNDNVRITCSSTFYFAAPWCKSGCWEQFYCGSVLVHEQCSSSSGCAQAQEQDTVQHDFGLTKLSNLFGNKSENCQFITGIEKNESDLTIGFINSVDKNVNIFIEEKYFKDNNLFYSTNYNENFISKVGVNLVKLFNTTDIKDFDYLIYDATIECPTCSEGCERNSYVQKIKKDYDLHQTSPRQSRNLNFDLIPNPTSGTVSVIGDLSEIVKIDITDLSGIKKVSITNNLQGTIDLSKLSNALYFVTFVTKNNDIFTKKLILQK